MAYLIWMVIWIFCQRGMMFLDIVAENTWEQTIGITLIAFIACYISYNNLLLILYVAWVIRWCYRCFETGGIIAGIMVLVFHVWLYLILLKKEQTS